MQKIFLPATRLLAGIFLCFPCIHISAHGGPKDNPGRQPQVLAPGYRALDFTAPQAGSYTLPVFGKAADGKVLDVHGNPSSLYHFLGDKYVVLSFIYTRCDDINGCPLATFVTSRVQNRLLDESSLHRRVRFISLSFDPHHDTPAVMRKYGENFIKQNFDWQFLTTSSVTDLNPVLKRYGQSILGNVDAKGVDTGSFSHILRVFLIDTSKQVRNIYSTSFLHPDIIINDIKTLVREADTRAANGLQHFDQKTVLPGSGDNRQGYETPSYESHSLSLQSRTGKKARLVNYTGRPPLGLPGVPVPVNNTLSPAKIQLGRELFYDRRLSHNNTLSCAMCHIPEQGFTSNELATAVGIEGRTVRRNAPTIYNVAYAKLLFHDGRETTLEQQIWGPLLAHNEMGNPSVGTVISRIKSIGHYREQFNSVFIGAEPDIKNIGEAIASYERTLVSGNSAFDRWYYGGNKNAMDSAAKHGYRLFAGKAHCTQCHLIGKTYALLTDNKLHNTGIGYLHSMKKDPEVQKVLVAPGTWLNVRAADLADASEAEPNDLGRYEISGVPDDRWKYKTPTLRNIALTAPYMHDGSFANLREVIEFYNNGGIDNALLDPLIQPLGLDPAEINQLLTFLNALTGDNVDVLVEDAFAAPVGNVN